MICERAQNRYLVCTNTPKKAIHVNCMWTDQTTTLLLAISVRTARIEGFQILSRPINHLIRICPTSIYNPPRRGTRQDRYIYIYILHPLHATPTSTSDYNAESSLTFLVYVPTAIFPKAQLEISIVSIIISNNAPLSPQ